MSPILGRARPFAMLAAAGFSASLITGGTAVALTPSQAPPRAAAPAEVTALVANNTLLISGTNGPDVITVKGALEGCSTNDPNITSITGSIKGTLNAPSSSFTSLLGPSAATGTITVTWKTVPALVTKTTTITISSGDIVGGTNSPFGDSASYGQFNISGATQTGSFGGGDNGASSFTKALTVEGFGTLAAEGTGAGIKAVTSSCSCGS